MDLKGEEGSGEWRLSLLFVMSLFFFFLEIILKNDKLCYLKFNLLLIMHL